MKPKSLKMADAEVAWLGRYGNNFSGQVHEDLALLQEATRHGESLLAGKFTVAEACLLCDVLNGHLFSPQFFGAGPQLLAAEVEDGCRLDGLGDKWSVDGAALAAKCASLSPWEAYAVMHLTRTFWAGDHDGAEIRDGVAKIFRCN